MAIMTAMAIMIASPSGSWAQESIQLIAPQNLVSSSSSIPSGPSVTPAQAKRSVEWLSTVAVRRMPQTFQGDKDWGKTKQVWSGVKMRMDGLKLKTHRRHRTVNHGRWIQYEVSLRPAEQSSPGMVQNAAKSPVTIHSVSPQNIVDGMPGRWKIDSSATLPMKFKARVQRWNLGIRIFSITIDGNMTVSMRSSSTVSFVPDYSEIPPALRLEPRVENAELRLESFEVDRVSRIGGDAAEGWGEIMQEVLIERFVKKQSDRLPEKLNRSIDKNRDDLKISMADWLATW